MRDLLAMVRGGSIARGTVLVVEDIHRLSREGALTVWPILSDLVNAGMVLVTGVTKKVWCEGRLNSSENHELQAAINGAAEYAANLSHMASRAHASRRRKMAEGLPVLLNGRPPGWIDREVHPDGTKGGYALNHHAETIRRIFHEAAEGRSLRAIVDGLNEDTVPLPRGEAGEWRVPRVSAILHDRHVLGLHTPKRRKGRGQVDVLGPERRVYPPVIDAATWDRARAMLEGKSTLVGRPGRSVTNLFTGKVVCVTCGAPMRVDTGGGIRRGRRRKVFVCARHIESRTCTDGTRYDLHHFEAPITMALVEMTKFAPRKPTTDTNALDEEIGVVRVDIEDREASLDVLRPKIGKSPVHAEMFDRLADEVHALRQRKASLEAKRLSAKGEASRLEDTWRLMKETVAPAMRGDVAARDRLRGMLAPLPFRIVGDGYGGLEVRHGGLVRTIHAAGDERNVVGDDELALA